jgi:hypothetical protein
MRISPKIAVQPPTHRAAPHAKSRQPFAQKRFSESAPIRQSAPPSRAYLLQPADSFSRLQATIFEHGPETVIDVTEGVLDKPPS